MSRVWQEWSQALIPAMDAAGRAIRAVAHNHVQVQHKCDASPVTEADLAANRILLQAIRALDKAPILSEEGCGQAPEQGDPEQYWCVDPLDGTKEFLKGNNEYTVNVALISAGAPVLGLVLQPDTGDLWIGVRGQHARLRRADHWLDIKACTSPRIPRVALSRSHGCTAMAGCLEHLGEFQGVTLGSSLKLTWLAEGRIDLYPRLQSGMSQWDLAAGHAVLLASGGELTDLDGAPLRYRYSVTRAPAFLAFGDHHADWPQRFRQAKNAAMVV